ncbi:MAG: EamA family transporter [Candidatus Aenigmarchaeota archaeon]|nr:EamA family transporter [Candidatus Aenigmarchaeota archaeon]
MVVQKKAILSIILSSILFGTIGVLVRMIDTEIPPITQSLFRGAAALLLIALVSLPKNKDFFKITKKDIPFYFLAGVFGYGMMLAFFTLSVINTSIANTFFLMFTESFFVVIIAAIFLKEKITKDLIVTLFLGFLGVFFIFSPQSLGNNFVGNLYGLAAGFVYALYIVVGRHMGKKYSSSTNTLWSFIFGVLFLLPVTLWLENPFMVSASPFIWFLVFLMGTIISTAYFLLNYGLKNLTAGYGGILLLLEPVSAVFFALLFFGEIPPTSTLVGALLIMSSVAYLTYKKTRKK